MIFYTNDLLSKWGFSDGDILDDFLWNNNISLPSYEGEDYSRSHQALIHVVKTLIIPELDQRVAVTVIGCIHNPIRAVAVNDRDVTGLWTRGCAFELITPRTIEIPNDKILAILHDFAAKPPPASSSTNQHEP